MLPRPDVERQAEIWGPGNVVETPHLDALAAKGVIALSAYAASPISAPTRSCFQTGLFSHNTGVPTNDQVMKRDLETFAEALGNKGYSTGYIGKWLDGDGPATMGNRKTNSDGKTTLHV